MKRFKFTLALFAVFAFAVFASPVFAATGTMEPPLEPAFNFQVVIGFLAPLIVIGLTQIFKIWIKSKFAPIIVLLLGGISTLIGVGPAAGEGFIDATINVAWVSGFATLIYDLVKKLKMKTTVIKVGAGAIILCFLLSGCGAINESGIKEKWEALTPDEKARIVLSDFQGQLSNLFDQGKAFVESNPKHLSLWKEKIVPAFDTANKAIKVSIETGKAKGLTPEIIYRDIGPLVESVVKLLIQIGAIKPIEAAIPLAAIAMILAAINALIGTAFRLYTSLKQIQGEEPIPTWEEITDENKLLQVKIDAEKSGG